MDIKASFEEVKQDLQLEINSAYYDIYIANLEVLKIDKNKLIVYAPTATCKNQLLVLYKFEFTQAVKRHFEGVDEVLVLDPSEKEQYIEEITAKQMELQAREKMNEKNKLNEKYTFDNFVVGKSNQFVYAASLAVAENPGKKFNPLFIYGGVGLGKTHLLHAIGNFISKKNPSARILYVTSEQFTNDYIQALKADKKENANKLFRDKYREVDVLMIDDIQFIANKQSTQEEFFHTFNDLYQLNKQIVITSDQHPRNIQLLEERLRSRFTGGLIQDIQKPDYELRLAILQKMAERENMSVEDEVLSFLAEKIDTDIRELESSLVKVCSLSTLLGKSKATLEDAEEALKDILLSKKEALNIEKIIDMCCDYFKVKKSDLIGKKKSKEIVDPRQITMYVATELLDLPLTTIGEYFGGRDHTTVIHARDKVADNLKKNRALKTDIEDLISMIRSKT